MELLKDDTKFITYLDGLIHKMVEAPDLSSDPAGTYVPVDDSGLPFYDPVTSQVYTIEKA